MPLDYSASPAFAGRGGCGCLSPPMGGPLPVDLVAVSAPQLDETNGLPNSQRTSAMRPSVSIATGENCPCCVFTLAQRVDAEFGECSVGEFARDSVDLARVTTISCRVSLFVVAARTNPLPTGRSAESVKIRSGQTIEFWQDRIFGQVLARRSRRPTGGIARSERPPVRSHSTKSITGLADV